MHPVAGRDLGQFIRHAGAAGNPRHLALGPFQQAVEDRLRAAHFPQDVDVDRAAPVGDLEGVETAADHEVGQFPQDLAHSADLAGEAVAFAQEPRGAERPPVAVFGEHARDDRQARQGLDQALDIF